MLDFMGFHVVQVMLTYQRLPSNSPSNGVPNRAIASSAKLYIGLSAKI
jgi:hypothetical protein